MKTIDSANIDIGSEEEDDFAESLKSAASMVVLTSKLIHDAKIKLFTGHLNDFVDDDVFPHFVELESAKTGMRAIFSKMESHSVANWSVYRPIPRHEEKYPELKKYCLKILKS